MKFKYYLLVFLFLVACDKEDEPTSIFVIGHGGMGLDFSGSIYHDNSKEAFDLALDIIGCDGIEMDVRMSKDGELWAFHDQYLDKETNNSGCIEEKNFSDLAPTKYKGSGKEILLRLKELDLNTLDKKIFLDIKHYNACQGSIHDVNAFISALNDLPDYFKNNAHVHMVVSNPDWIPYFINAGFQVLYTNDSQSNIDEIFQLYPGTIGLVIKNLYINEDEVKKYIKQNKSVYIYEVRSPKKLKEVRRKNPTGVMSDDVQGAVLEMK